MHARVEAERVASENNGVICKFRNLKECGTISQLRFEGAEKFCRVVGMEWSGV